MLAVEAPPQSRIPPRRIKPDQGNGQRNAPLKDAVLLQRELRSSALDKETSPAAKAQLARAWAELEELKREIRGIGKPKPVQAKNERTKPSRSTPVEPQE